MNDGLIPNRYAKALYKFAVDNGDDAAVYDEMKQLDESFAAVAALKSTVDNPFVSIEDKEKVLLSAAGAKAGGSLDKFILLVIKNNRTDFMRAIALSYVKLYREQRGIARVEVVTASQMPADEINAIIGVVKSKLPGKTMELTKKIDENLIGGFKINVDSLVLDASVENELKKLRLKLLS